MADLTPQELMKTMGINFFDPIPPQQHAWPMKLAAENPSKVPPLFRLWSWMCAHTIRKGRRKGYVCDERGRPLTIEHAAHDLQMDPGVCRRAWRDGAALGLWRKGTNASDKRQLFLNGKVVPVTLEPAEEEGQEDDSNTKKGEEEAKEVCTDLFAPYILKQIKRLPKKTREVLVFEYNRNERLKKDVHADVTVAVRLIFDQRQDTLFSKYGVKKIREEHAPKNGKVRPPERTKLVQELLPGLQKFVQTFEERFVQDQGESVQTQKDPVVPTVEKRPKNGTSPAVSRTSTNGDKRAVLEGERTSLAAPSLFSKQVPSSSSLESHVAHELKIDDDAARQLVIGCKAVARTVTGPEIVELARVKLHDQRESIRKGAIANVTGFLIKAVPKMCSGATLQDAREALRERDEKRTTRLAYVRETWHEFDAEERQRALKEFPELADKSKGASGDD